MFNNIKQKVVRDKAYFNV